MFDIAIKSERVITRGDIRNAVVLVKDGKIVDVVSELPSEDILVIDVGNKVLMPGVIDPHVHINEPGRTEWEGFDTATKAAIAGGITTLVDMPLNSSPVTTTVKAFDEKIKAAGGDQTEASGQTGTVRPVLHTNCGFWGGVIPGNEKEIRTVNRKRSVGFQSFSYAFGY